MCIPIGVQQELKKLRGRLGKMSLISGTREIGKRDLIVEVTCGG
jgi:hypothetical protein